MNQAQKVTRKMRSEQKMQKSRPKKRKQFFNPKTVESDESSFIKSRKKLKLCDEINVPVNNSIEYRIINFSLVFGTLSQYVKCKTCDGHIEFAPIETRGLGFKIALICDKCVQRKINSCSTIDRSYEINRRFILTMRLLGLGLTCCTKFCALMDMPPFLFQSTYDIILKHICTSVKLIFDQFIKYAMRQEIEKINETIENFLTVSGNGTWKKRGFTSLYGIASLIGCRTGKILDLVVKSVYCQFCQMWEKKKGLTEYEEWKKAHETECIANLSKSANKMEIDAMIEMFQRSENLHGFKYANYIGDGIFEKCICANNNESYNQLVWKISSKNDIPKDVLPIEIAAYISACIFNEGYSAVLKIFESLGIPCGPHVHQFVAKEDEERVSIVEQYAQKERQHQIDILEAERALYEIEDFISAVPDLCSTQVMEKRCFEEMAVFP